MHVLLTLLLSFSACSLMQAADRPNFLWLSTEDMSPHLGCYGDEQARTPHLDSLAAEGLLYTSAFVPSPVCATCRSSIITGVYASSLGTHHMRSRVKVPAAIPCFTEHLRQAGYYCTNNSKEDYNFKTPKTAWDASDSRAHWRNRPDANQPFFAVFNFTGTHESVTRGDEPKYSQTIANLAPQELCNPASLYLPPYYPETPKVRNQWARYYNTIAALDKWIGQRLAELEAAGLSDDTIVFFWSDHGVGLPRAKRWLYDSGMRVPLIVHVPNKYRRPGDAVPGDRLGRLVSLVDLPPTLLNLAGLEVPKYMQGCAFLGDGLAEERDHVYATRDRMDESYDMVRAVRDKRYKYIRNFMPWRPYAQYQSYGEDNDLMRELRRLSAASELNSVQSRFMRLKRPVEELYDLKHDPHELKNLAANREYEALRRRMAAELRQWMIDNRDLGILPEGRLMRMTAKGKTRYQLFRGPSGRQDYEAALDAAIAWVTTASASNAVNSVSWPLEDDPSDRVLAAERTLLTVSIGKAERAEAINVLLQEYEHGDSRWDQIAAAGVIDLLPDFEQVTAQLAPINERVDAGIRGRRATAPGAEPLSRWVDRFHKRIHRN